MKKSIQLKLFYILSALVVAIILFYWLLNNLILEDYYLWQKQNMLIDTYKMINDHYNRGTTDIELEFEKLGANKNLNIIIINENYLTIYSTTKNNRGIRSIGQMLPNNFFREEKENLVEADKYVVEKFYDNRLNSYFIELVGLLDNGYYLLIRTPQESIRESVEIFNEFLMIAGLITIVVGAVIVMIISRQFAKPILELSNIAKDMSQLDFSKKYNVTGEDEINVLGNSINILSQQLETTISELKSANIQLRRDIEEKSQIDEMRREFLSNVSHELKTPIALIQGYAEGLKDNIVTDPQDKEFYCNVILEEAEKMGTLVKKLLTLMHIESGQISLNIRRFNITDMIQSLLEKNRILFIKNQIKISFNRNIPIFVWGDELWIEQVLSNYITNAIHHVDHRKKIQIKLTPSENLVKVSVFNTGKHIEEEDLDKIWESFYKVDKSRTQDYGGNGLGLSVVSAIMRLHDKPYGVLNVDGGVMFWFELDR